MMSTAYPRPNIPVIDDRGTDDQILYRAVFAAYRHPEQADREDAAEYGTQKGGRQVDSLANAVDHPGGP
jgi:hypothetical protein